KQIALPARSGTIGVVGSPPDGDSPYTYSGNIGVPASEALMDVVLSNCADPSANDMQIQVSIFGLPLDMGRGNTSADGITYDGSSTSQSGDGSRWSWTMKGDTNPTPPGG